MKSTLDVFEGMMLFFLRESKAALTREALDELLEAWYELRRAAEVETGEEPRAAEDPQGPQDAVPYEGNGGRSKLLPYEGAEEDPSTAPRGGSAQDNSGPEIPEGFEAVQPVKGFTGTGAKLKRETLEKLESRRKGGMSLEALSLKTNVPTDTLVRMLNREKVEFSAWEKVSKALRKETENGD